ncbi:BamA/TamA family outer membrane protein [Thiolapillus brandeum]|uniref:Bacterial surface antigen (D15) domain-containing protein n=1 Tax=Thiolapillus brandeum TaxID=1076588 RepID=A0A7U6JIH3_9GAMM|nr:hypothetical protein [Thiolapillus brandeum]BAO44245.1 conserved hypothetical protein [Thiolapillus brandeum]
MEKILVLSSLLLCLAGNAGADYITLDESEKYGETRWGAVPYAFKTEALGTAVGAAAYVGGINQPQSSLVGAAFTTSNDSWLIAGALNNFRFDNLDRWFFDLYAQGSHFTDQRFYDSTHRLTSSSSGSHDSSPDDYVSGISNDLHVEISARYVLPIGAGREQPLSIFKTRKGIPYTRPTGGSQWNPLSSGKTILGSKYFYRYRDLQKIDDENLVRANTNGLELWLDYNNTDFLPNASYGSRQKFTVTRDFGLGDSANSWTNLELDLSKYIDLGTSDWFRQQVLALNFWTSHTPTWKADKDSGFIYHRPPPGFGSELGGFDRMRAYPQGRFHDKSAVYYTAEMRLMPQVNGLDTLPLLKYLEIDWWQVVAFAEAGRVSPGYDTDLYFKDLKWDVGLSFRVMAFRVPLRLDWAISDEDYSIWAMYKQPFAR